MLLCMFHFAVCIKYEQKLGLLIAFPMIFELVLLYSGLQGMFQLFVPNENSFLFGEFRNFEHFGTSVKGYEKYLAKKKETIRQNPYGIEEDEIKKIH